VTCRVAYAPPPFVVNLGCGDVLVVEKILDGFNRLSGIEKQSRSRGPKGVGGVTTSCNCWATAFLPRMP